MNRPQIDFIRRWTELGNHFLVLPGWQNSGLRHWQTLWEDDYPAMVRVNQQDWEKPVAVDWVRAIQQHVQKIKSGKIIFIAHSLSCIAIAHWAHLYRDRAKQVAGGFLVSPVDVWQPNVPYQAEGFMPLPRVRLPFASMIVASDCDPYCHIDKAADLSNTWGSRLIVLHDTGHINVESGHGPWPYGLNLLSRFTHDQL